MSYLAQVSQNYAVAGKNFTLQQSISAPKLSAIEESIAVAWAGVLTTRTDGATGTLTMNSSGHLITTGAIIDLYWVDANGNPQQSRDALVGTVSGTSVPFTVSAGTALPAATTAINAGIQTNYTVSIVGNNVTGLFGACDIAPATISLWNVTPTEELVMGILPNGCYGWTGSGTNPLAGVTIVTIKMSHGDPLAVHNCRVTALLSA